MFQTFYTSYVIQRFREMQGLKNKFAAIFYGPSWQPGKPRLGLDEDKIKVSEYTKINKPPSCNY